MAAWRQAVARRVGDRPELPLPELVAECRSASPPGARALLLLLARVLGIGAGRLRARDLLDELLELRPRDLRGLTRKDRELLRARAALDPLPALLLEELRAVTTPSGWDAIGGSIRPPPLTDAQWLNVMLGLRVDEWVRTFAPAVRAAAIRSAAG